MSTVSSDVENPASNDIEAKLIELLAARLKLPTMGADDDFFALGGDSIMAVPVAHDISAAFGVECLPTALFQSPTPRKLARLVADGGGSLRSNVVALHKGNGLPLFFLCGIALYHPLANRLAGTCSSSAVYVPEEEALFESFGKSAPIAELARSYVAAIREQWSGPCAIAGISFGGLLAFEVARQLRAEGVKVAGLIVLDTVLPHACSRDWLEWVPSKLRQLTSAGVGPMLDEIRARFSPQTLELGMDGRRLRSQQLWQALQGNATKEYLQARPTYDASALVIRAAARESGPSLRIAPDLGWTGHLIGPTTFADVENDHLGILESDDTAAFSARYLSGIDARAAEPRVAEAHPPDPAASETYA